MKRRNTALDKISGILSDQEKLTEILNELTTDVNSKFIEYGTKAETQILEIESRIEELKFKKSHCFKK